MHTSKMPVYLGRAIAGVALSVVAAGCSAAAPATPPTSAAQPAAATLAAAKPSDASLKIMAPSLNGATGAGPVKISVTYSGPNLVPGAEAKKLDDYHLHYFLDEDANAYITGTKSIPTGNPHIVHSAAKEVTFDNVAPGKHTVAVVMSGNNHIPVAPALMDSVTFTVQ